MFFCYNLCERKLFKGRELKRKQAKKDKKPLKEEIIQKNEGPYDDIYKLLKTFGIMLAIILALYLFIAIVITKEIKLFSKLNQKEEIEDRVQDSILAKNTFIQSEEEYYVYFFDFDEENTTISALLSTKLYNKKVYKVDTGDSFNSNYVTKEEVGNRNATSIEDLKVVNPTLIKISSGNIVEYYETEAGLNLYVEQ